MHNIVLFYDWPFTLVITLTPESSKGRREPNCLQNFEQAFVESTKNNENPNNAAYYYIQRCPGIKKRKFI